MRCFMASTQTQNFNFAVVSFVLIGLLQLQPSHAWAAIPEAAKNDPLYAKGYLVVTHYAGVHNDGTNATSTTAGINQALLDAYNQDVPGGSLVAYFPPGTYLVNDTLKAFTQTASDPLGPSPDWATPRNHLAMMGSTIGPSRPLIKLTSGATGFGNAAAPKYLLEFRNNSITPPFISDPATGYHQMLRGIDLDCTGNAGAIGLFFSQAQDSSIENVKVRATGSVAGIRGLPARGWGAINIEIEGGKYGIDTADTTNAGSVLAGITLKNQTVSAIRHDGFVPLVVVGFNIVTPNGSTQPALTIEESGSSNAAGIQLIDGTITLGGVPTVAAIDNRAGKNFYARNVYVTGATKLVKSAALATVTETGQWVHIAEYSYCDQSPADSAGKQSYDLIDGLKTKTPAPRNNGEVVSVLASTTSAPPTDLASRHTWASLPSVDDADVYDPVAEGVITLNEGNANVSATALQAIIDNPAHKKIFLRKGIYHLDGTLVLRKDTVLFGAARFLSRIEVNGNTWSPTSETPMIRTVDDANATTTLSDVTIGVDATKLANDWFVALDWQAGRNSLVYMGQIYREPAATIPINRFETQPHSLIKIRNSGGGRWYFAGSRKTFTSDHNAFRILKVTGTTEPLWFYGLNLEHPSGCEAYGEISNAQNIRIYGMKSEFSGSAAFEDKSVLMKYTNVSNLAQFGSGALRNAVQNRGAIEFLGVNTNRVLATLIAPQVDNGTATGDTLRENRGTVWGVEYPHVVALYKRGEITQADEAAMTHSNGNGGDNTGGGNDNTGGGNNNTGGGSGNTGGGHEEAGDDLRATKPIVGSGCATAPDVLPLLIGLSMLRLRRSGRGRFVRG